jgi:hypothetical protein
MNQETEFETAQTIITASATSSSLSQILPYYDGIHFENATTLYRKPSYQRALRKSDEWCIKLVESIIKGYTTGSITMSEWTCIQMVNDCPVPYTYFNIEDGQTRLDAYQRFRNGDFTTRYGNYEDVSQKFDNYQHSVIMLRKVNALISDTDYFKALQENFSLLQEGTPLSTSDRYWVWFKNDDHNFAGSPIVNYTVELVNEHETLSEYFTTILGVAKLSNRVSSNNKSRKLLAELIALVSGAVWGSEYTNCKYFTHVPILTTEITDEEKAATERLLHAIFIIISNALEAMNRAPNERIASYFIKPHKFTSCMIDALYTPIRENDENDILNISNCYLQLINSFRISKLNSDNNWFNNNIYMNLTKGQTRNLTQADIIARKEAIKTWWDNQ